MEGKCSCCDGWSSVEAFLKHWRTKIIGVVPPSEFGGEHKKRLFLGEIDKLLLKHFQLNMKGD